MFFMDCRLALLFISFLFRVFAAHAEDSPLNQASKYGAYIFQDFEASSGSVNGALAVGGNLTINGYSVASEPSVPIGEYGLQVEGDARFDFKLFSISYDWKPEPLKVFYGGDDSC